MQSEDHAPEIPGRSGRVGEPSRRRGSGGLRGGQWARIISASWGGNGQSEILRRAIARANNSGILFVAAAGNESQNNDAVPNFPSNYDLPNIIAVAATDRDDSLADFSNFGRTTVDLASPGVDILSTVPIRRADETTPRSGYASFNGTSMATPIVSGTAALVIAHTPSLSHLDVKSLLLQSVDSVSGLNGRVSTGGRLNVARALSPPLPTPLASPAAQGVAAASRARQPDLEKRIQMRVTPLPFVKSGEKNR